MTAPSHLPGAPQELRWQANGLEIAGLAWGPEEGRPVLALHGWMDNAASFALLAPRLEDCRVVAPDLTGHGRSAARSADSGYQIWDDLPEMVTVADLLGWEQFNLLGHSRGGIISTLLASAFPERVQRLVLLDALAPPPLEQAAFPSQLRQAIVDKARLLHRGNRRFDSIDDAVASRERAGLDARAARLIAERNLAPREGGFAWTTDPRLTGASMAKLTQGQTEAVLRALTMPVLLLLATEASRRHPQIEQLARACIGQLQIREIDGGHHFHMEDGVAETAEWVSSFLGDNNHAGSPS